MAGKSRELQLPVSRVKTIMKSSPEVDSVGQDSLNLVTKATELFIQDLAKRALRSGDGRNLEYSNVAEVVQAKENLFFLREIIPKKITVKEYKMLMKSEGLSDGIPSNSESSEEEEQEEEEEEGVEDEEEEEEEEEENVEQDNNPEVVEVEDDSDESSDSSNENEEGSEDVDDEDIEEEEELVNPDEENDIEEIDEDEEDDVQR